MVHPSRINRYDIRNGSTILLADNSQESRYNVTDVEHAFAVGHSQVRSTYGSAFTIKITEPNGTTLLEKIALSAKSLGIDNHILAGYYITIEFNGRLPNGSARKDPHKFIYAISINNIQMQVTAGGAEYNIEAVETHTGSFNYLEQVIRSQITLEAGTVGEFITEFLTKLDKSLDNELLFNINAAYKDTYVIDFDAESGTDEWLRWPMQQADESLRVSGQSRIGDKIHFTIPNGSNLSDIIGMALQSTEEYKRILTATNSFMKPAPGDPSNLQLDEFPVFYKVTPKIEFGQFDPLRGDFVRTITFSVKKHIVTDRIMDSAQYINGITNTMTQNSRVNNMFSLGLLRKRYDYIFTGLNTEILNLDLKFDNQYYEISVIGNGQVGDPNVVASTSGQSAQTVHDAIETVKREIVSISNRISRLQQQQAGTVDLDDGQDRSQIGSQIEELEQERSNKQNSLDEQLSVFSSLTAGNGNPPANGSFFTAQEASSDISMRVRFAGDIVDDGDIYGPENDLTGGVLQFGAVKSNLENSADMMKIELVIRGDPYWMGQPNSFFRGTIGAAADLADYEQGGVNFFLNVKFPIGEDGSGRRRPRDDYTLSGVYRVISVISRFSGGQFVQYLESVRDLATNTATVLSTLQSGSTDNGGASRSSSGSIAPTNNTDPAQVQETS